MDGYVTDMTAYETVDYLTKIQELLQKELVENCGYTLKFNDEAETRKFITATGCVARWFVLYPDLTGAISYFRILGCILADTKVYELKFDDGTDVKTFISFVDQLKCALQKYKKDFMGI